jgi:hypothetical protein
MNSKRTLLAIAALSFATAASGAIGVLSGPVVNPANGHLYYLLDNSKWTDAEAQAVAMGGHLATVRNSAENLWLFNTFAGYGGVDRFLLIGLNDAAVEGNFVWASGEPFTYGNWAPYEPNNWIGIDDYVEIFPAHVPRAPDADPVPAGTWNDIEDSANPDLVNPPSGNVFGPVYGVVEIVPEPSTTALGALMATLALILRGTRSHPRRRRF